ncbi:hypothetical protein E1B28_008439 [Marasmius oreades]|uniref:Uncharacterized protein n=1 Tax=Marasmius oreades TaxID=181124 RepID=A0A9P7US48_9AGAR|nr:uncharacterized protein E1B28_008439 [Marasmius oreades]KAG7092058.1 hypothetical protein E1B28_008439 [Marasmius oreades]
MMLDKEFAKHLITLMLSGDDWRFCRDPLRYKLKVCEAAGRPLLSATVIETLRVEEIEKRLGQSVAEIHAIVASGKGKGRIKNEAAVVPSVYNYTSPPKFTANTSFAGPN